MYNFKKAKLEDNFAREKQLEFKSLIQNSQSFTVLSMPGVGVSYFLRFLVTRNFARFYHVDLYSLPTLTTHEFFKLLFEELTGREVSKETHVSEQEILTGIRGAIQNAAKEAEKLVIIFSRFDQLSKEFTAEFFSTIQSLTNIAPLKTCLIFTSIKPLHEIAPEAVTGGNLPFYAKTVYFKPFTTGDIKALLRLEAQYPHFPKNLGQLIELSGGHIQLLHILLNSQKEQLLLDQFVKLQMKDLIDYLDYQQRKQVQKIALGKKVSEIDEYLLGVGLVKKSTSEVKKMQLHLGGVKFELFSPLLSDYIKTNMPVKLPVKEAKLFKLLRNNIGRTVSKDEIFEEVWGKDSEEATDWALDALIYRLRKHPFIKSNGYIIESHKKVGYTLIQT